MEFTEVVSPSVAVPVICVLVCAFLVFAFGFKSPPQPPSFDVFDEDGKKKRARKSKGYKNASSDHAVSGAEANANNSALAQPSSRQTSKQQTSKSPAPASKTKVVSQVVQESQKKEKVKKSAPKEEVAKPAKKQKVEEDFDGDVDGWHTVPKKEKKQKKRETERQESPVKEKEIIPKNDEPEETFLQVTKESPGSPQEQRNKKKKEKKNEKLKEESAVVEPVKVEPEVVVAAAAASGVNVDTEPQNVETNIELQIQDAIETTVDQSSDGAEKKKKPKKDKKKIVEDDDFVIPQAAMKSEVVQQQTDANADLPLKENKDALTVKTSKKKQKKDKNKKNDEKLPASIDIGASGEVDSSLSQCSVSEVLQKETKIKDNSVQGVPLSPPGEEGGASSDLTTSQQATATFDELGGTTESWTEAKPKSKKKKARRAD